MNCDPLCTQMMTETTGLGTIFPVLQFRQLL